MRVPSFTLYEGSTFTATATATMLNHLFHQTNFAAQALKMRIVTIRLLFWTHNAQWPSAFSHKHQSITDVSLRGITMFSEPITTMDYMKEMMVAVSLWFDLPITCHLDRHRSWQHKIPASKNFA